jgi:hypothetical protein
MGTSVTAGVTESASITPMIVANRLNMLEPLVSKKSMFPAKSKYG